MTFVPECVGETMDAGYSWESSAVDHLAFCQADSTYDFKVSSAWYFETAHDAAQSLSTHSDAVTLSRAFPLRPFLMVSASAKAVQWTCLYPTL